MTQFWFRPKRYGYGATPTTWQGWAVTFAFAAAMAASIVAVERLAGPTNTAAWLGWAAFMLVALLWFVQFSRRRTEGEWRWRWGAEDRKG